MIGVSRWYGASSAATAAIHDTIQTLLQTDAITRINLSKDRTMACEQLFLQELKKKGYRFTPQREIVLEIMHHLDKPATAEEIFAHVREITKTVDKSTVYRTLDLLQEFGLVSVIDSGEREHLYEHLGTDAPHLHLVCESCGKIIGIGQESILPFADYLLKTTGFEVSIQNTTIPGLCDTCRENKHQVAVIEQGTQQPTIPLD